MAERILDVNLAKQHRSDLQLYAIYISRHRVIPDYKDGLKPVHRRIVYSMYHDSNAINGFVKSLKVIGNVLGMYHPHGDSSVYDAIKPLTNWFEINKPLIDNQGSFGNIQGDSASQARYTEVKLSKFALDCVISDLKEFYNVVDWVPNYNEEIMEPEFLPTALPTLLINGALGIGTGVKVEIPRHNINDVIDATLALLNNPDSSIELVPDHCMPCEIVKTNFKAISNKGNGSYTVRGIIDIEENKGKYNLVIKSLPDLTFLSTVISKVEDMVKENEIIQIQDMYDESDGDNLRFVIVLRKGADPHYVKEKLYKDTEMKQTCRVNFEVLDGLNPVRMSYKSYILSWIEFRKLTKFRLYNNKLQAVQTKFHEREIYIKVLQSGYIDDIIHMIRNQTSIDDNYMIEFLVTKLNITDIQAKFILNTDIRKLSKGYLNKYIQDSIELKEEENILINKIVDESIIVNEIINELKLFKNKYGNHRRCKLITLADSSNIPSGKFKIIITENNFVKKVQVNDPIGYLKGDAPKIVLTGENEDNIIIFDEMGRAFKLPIHKIQFSDKNSNGIDIRFLIKNLTSNINSVIYEPVLKDFANKQSKYFLTVVTKQGNIKKLDIDDFLTVPPSGILFTKLDQGDYIQDVMVISNQSDIIIYSHNKALRINMSEVPHFKRNTKGSRVMNTNETIDGISLIKHDTTDVVVITEGGRVNRINVAALPVSSRGKAGSNVIKLSKDDRIKAIYGLNEKDSIRIVTKNDRLVIPIIELQEGSSISTGVKLVPTKNDIILKCDVIKNK